MEGFSKNDENNNMKEEEQEEIIQDEQVAQLMQTLPMEKDDLTTIVKYQGYWYIDLFFKSILAFQKHFQARDSDIIILSFPKTGNTWLKALIFAIINRGTQNLSLLFQKHPHELVFHLENDVYGKAFDYPQPHHLHQMCSPRLFSTHVPYHSLPDSIKTSKCRFLYLTRNPLDTFVSLNYFTKSAMKNMLSVGEEKQFPTMDEFFERYCYQGKTSSGPFFKHVKEHWEKSLQDDKMMFLMYEDLKDDPIVQVKKIAEFIGFPFSSQEENDGVVEKMVEICSFESMKDLDGNKNGVISKYFDKKSYFRKGKVGDWSNHLSVGMVDKLMKFTQSEFDGSGLSFKFNSC